MHGPRHPYDTMTSEGARAHTVVGHPYGMSKLGLEAGCDFILQRPRGGGGPTASVTSITIPRIEALPSYCPWITYELRVCARPGGNVYDVLDVQHIEARHPVRKKDVIAFLLDVKQTEKPRVYATWLRRTLRALPEDIDTLDAVHHAVEDDDLLRDRIVRILAPCFRGPAYMHLLYYFGDAFLAPLSTSQLATLQFLVQTTPHIFCFWDLAVRRVPDMACPLPLSYAFLCEDIVLAPADAPTYYRARYPGWSLNRLWEAYAREQLTPVGDRVVLAHALHFGLQADKHFYSFGDTSFSYGAFVRAPGRSEDELKRALDFLCTRVHLFVHTRARAVVATYADLWVSKTQRAFEEITLVRTLATHVQNVHLIHCPYYHDAFVRNFCAWIEQHQLLQHQSTTLLLSANAGTAKYLKEKTGLSIFSVEEAASLLEEAKRPMRQCGEHIRHVVIDRAHKIGAQHLLAILRPLQAKGNISLHLVGDLTEAPVHAHRGGGALMHDLAQCGYPITRWTSWPPDDPMLPIYHDLERRTLARVQVFHFEKRKDLEDKLDVLKRQIKQKRKNTPVHAERKNLFPIFCSSEADREELLHITFAKQQLPYAKKLLYIGEEVHLLELDVMGTLERAVHMRMDAAGVPGVRTPVHGKGPVDLRCGEYLLTVGGREYSTQDYTVQHADVMVMSKFCGVPRAHALFVVGTSTRRSELVSAVKYCTHSLHIFVLPGVQFQGVDHRRDTARRTGLVAKWQLAHTDRSSGHL